MQQFLPNRTAPSFYLTSRQPIRPGVILLAIVAAGSALTLVMYGMDRSRHAPFRHGSPDAASPATASAGAAPAPASDDKDDKDDNDDPSQIDTIVLGDPADAPVPGRHGNHVSPVHPTIVIRLPRYGDQVGLIPASPAGHLLYKWLAAFNQASDPALNDALPTVALSSAVSAQMGLRRETGGFNLLSAKEVEPGILVFRLRDQTPQGIEVLGTLQMRPESSPPAIASFSLRAISPTQPHSTSAPQ